MNYLERFCNNAIIDEDPRNIKDNTYSANVGTHSFGVLSHSLNSVLFMVSKIALPIQLCRFNELGTFDIKTIIPNNNPHTSNKTQSVVILSDMYIFSNFLHINTFLHGSCHNLG